MSDAKGSPRAWLASTQSARRGLRHTHPSDFQPAPADGNVAPEDDAHPSSMKQKHNQPFVNRALSCIATPPLGRTINKFQTILELLEACRDVAKALRSLYQDKKILHRDVCTKNLIIPLHPEEGDAKGVLINLDFALDLEKGPAKKGELVGSEGFMAIGILTGDAHTYRHDLESLFYVFLWAAICNDPEHDDTESLRGRHKMSRLWGWCSTNFRSVAQNKTVDMSPDGFLAILYEFSAEFKHLRELAGELRQLLFPMRNGELFTGSDMDQDGVDMLYDGIIDALNRAIALEAHE
ncbi:hypothetical protein ACJ41O_010032 [Fusarium nematophilum]